MRRFTVLVLCAATTLFAPALARSSAAAPLASAGAQSFTGGGSGSVTNVGFRGRYASNGQLGSGQLSIHAPAVPSDIGELDVSFVRSDGMALSGTDLPGVLCGNDLAVGCDKFDLTGTGDIVAAHFFVVIDRTGNAFTFLMKGTLTPRNRVGYAMVNSDGTVYPFGGIESYGNATTGHAPTTDVELTPSHRGYWTTDEFGNVSAFGDAPALGSADPIEFATGGSITSISATPTGLGYWLFTASGRAIPFGDAHHFGDMDGAKLNGSIVGSIAAFTGNGYYMVGSDGGVFAFGDAKYRGSMGNIRLNEPVVGLVPTPDNRGYWLVATDGGVFSFGDATFHGSMGGTHLNKPIVAMVAYGDAYLMVASDGGVFNFSHSPFFGSLGGRTLPVPIVNAAGAS